MSMSILRSRAEGARASTALRWAALGLCASLSFSGCDDDPDRPSTSLDPSKADPPSLDGTPLPRPSGISTGNKVGSDEPDASLDGGTARPPPPPLSDAGAADSGVLRPPGPGDFLGFDAAIALRAER